MRDWATEFFAGDSLKRVLTYLCNARAPGAWDPITATVVDLLTGRLQLTLTPAGLLPFKGKTALVYPYHMMSPAQKELPRGLLEDRSSFVVCSDSVVFHWREGDPERLDPVPVLLAMCQGVLATLIHEDHKVSVGICNILLQRVQSAVPISRGAQQELNSLLFCR